MPIVTPTQVVPGNEIKASDVNTPVNQIANLVNGNLGSDNLAANSVGTTQLQDNSVGTNQIIDGSIQPSKLGFRTTNLIDHGLLVTTATNVTTAQINLKTFSSLTPGLYKVTGVFTIQATTLDQARFGVSNGTNEYQFFGKRDGTGGGVVSYPITCIIQINAGQSLTIYTKADAGSVTLREFSHYIIEKLTNTS